MPRTPDPVSQRSLPDILRPTELADFGDAFRTSPRLARTVVAAAGLAGLLTLAHLAAQDPAPGARDGVAAAPDPDERGKGYDEFGLAEVVEGGRRTAASR
jgi:hypothetical protein